MELVAVFLFGDVTVKLTERTIVFTMFDLTVAVSKATEYKATFAIDPEKKPEPLRISAPIA